MQKAEGPGDTPEWKSKLTELSPFSRMRFSVALGVTDRTVKNWVDGKTEPNEATVQRIQKQLAKGKTK